MPPFEALRPSSAFNNASTLSESIARGQELAKKDQLLRARQADEERAKKDIQKDVSGVMKQIQEAKVASLIALGRRLHSLI